MANVLKFNANKISTVRDYDSVFNGKIKSVVAMEAKTPRVRVTVITVEAVEEVKASGTGAKAIAAVAAVAEETAQGVVMLGNFIAATKWATDAITMAGADSEIDLDHFVGMKAERVITNEDSTDSIKPTQLTISVN